MSGNSYKQQKRSRSFISLIVILITAYMLIVVSYDAFVGTPIKTQRIEEVAMKFNDFQTFINAKLPEIDSALIEHAHQIDEQNRQLEELNKLTEVLREENNQ